MTHRWERTEEENTSLDGLSSSKGCLRAEAPSDAAKIILVDSSGPADHAQSESSVRIIDGWRIAAHVGNHVSTQPGRRDSPLVEGLLGTARLCAGTVLRSHLAKCFFPERRGRGRWDSRLMQLGASSHASEMRSSSAPGLTSPMSRPWSMEGWRRYRRLAGVPIGPWERSSPRRLPRPHEGRTGLTRIAVAVIAVILPLAFRRCLSLSSGSTSFPRINIRWARRRTHPR